MHFKYTLFITLLIGGLLAACSKPLYIRDRSYNTYTVGNNTSADSELVRMLRPYKAGVDTQMQVVIGSTDMPLTKAQPESSLGNFMADAQLASARKVDNKVVASVINYGGIRLSYLAPGPITRGKMYELMPFENMITIVDVPGTVFKEFCDHMAKAKGWPIAGLSYVLDDKKATDIIVRGEPLNEHIIYKVAVSDYIANGGDHCDFLTPLNKKHTGILVRDALIDYVAKSASQNKSLHPLIERRVRYAE